MDTTISGITDPDFRAMIGELCQCLNLDESYIRRNTVSYLLMVIGQERKGGLLKPTNLLEPEILSQKIEHLDPGSVVYCVCSEIARRSGMEIESFAEDTVLLLIKDCYTGCCPGLSRKKSPTRLERRHRLENEVIERRRRNGDL